ncbi:unnamed protein product [Auanema sp. JU1783]|nr:unnamed protein product [Auanema sp. JU1783]
MGLINNIKLIERISLISIRRTSLLNYSSAASSTADKKDKLQEIDPLKEYTPFGGIRKKTDIWHYTDRKVAPGYSNYSSNIYQHRPYIWPPLRKLYKFNYYIVGAIFFFLCWDYEWLSQQFAKATNSFKPSASQLNTSEESKKEEENDSKPEKPITKKVGFRERRVVEYEDRLRMYSTPDKIFRYFATLKVNDKNDDSGRTYEVFMLPEDFLRSLTPGVMQPRRLGLDSYRVYQPEKHHHNFSDESSIFYKLGENGLISFSDYLFLMTLLCTSPNDFALAFKIFDVNGDGELDKAEFERVKMLIMSQTTVGQRHRDHVTPNFSYRAEANSGLEAYFFGKDGNRKLSAEKFLEFQRALHEDILKMEFARRHELDGENGLISEESFAQHLLLHAQIPEKRQKLMLKRIRRKFKEGPGVSYEEVSSFFKFLYHIDDVDMALHFHRMAGLAVEGTMFKRVASMVAHVELSDHIVDVVITLFDDNQDGKLSNDEMIAVMRRRLRRGLERPKDTGLFRLFDGLQNCTKRALQASSFPFS